MGVNRPIRTFQQTTILTIPASNHFHPTYTVLSHVYKHSIGTSDMRHLFTMSVGQINTSALLKRTQLEI